MKKYLFIAVLSALSFLTLPNQSVFAQSSYTVSRTISAADTVTWPSVASRLKAMQYTFTKTTGSPSGKVILEGTVNGTWIGVDSFTIANQAEPQTKQTTFTSTTFKGYRYRCTASPGAIVATYLRRSDE